MAGPELIEGIRRDTTRALLRGRNGLKYVAGLGRPLVGQSPKDLIWRREKTSLFRYRSTRRSDRRPLVIVFSVLGRSYVLDLMPGSSFVARLLEAGTDVFLIDFGEPDAADSGNTLETYVDNHLPRAVAAAAAEAGADTVDLLGYCFGGLLAVLLVAGHPELPVHSLAVMAAPIDFAHTEGALQALASGRLSIEDVIDETGNVPAEAVHRMFRSLKPTSGIAAYATLWEKMWNDDFVEGFQAMGQWARDQVPFPGALARQATELLLRRNALMSGAIRLGDRDVQLADVTCPLLNIVAQHDHVVPPATARPLADLVSSVDASELLVPAGHIGLAMSHQSVRYTIPGLTTWLTDHN
jgi:poly[(R)-3-hydroxyalkanoate] polymerase subunit PhaC